MATKRIAWNSGGGYITLTYTGQGNGSVSVSSDKNTTSSARSQYITIKTSAGSPTISKSLLVKQKAGGIPVGTTYEFEYTGAVQSIELPAGRYKLECWGAQGGNTSSYSGEGSYGGYSEGVLTLTETTTLYIFVGGRGSSSGNGGWNGGGSSTGYSSYSSGDESGESWPACGGGATDISTVTSSMAYSNGRTNRSAASLLARCIVAGGGAGASARYTEKTVTVTESTEELLASLSSPAASTADGLYHESRDQTDYIYYYAKPSLYAGDVLTMKDRPSDFYQFLLYYIDTSGASKVIWSLPQNQTIVVPSDFSSIQYWNIRFSGNTVGKYTDAWVMANIQIYKVVENSTTTTEESSDYTAGGGEGGGTTGNGSYKGTQSSAGSGGGFGYGANQDTSNYMYCGGAGGGGWYGGGTYHADGSTDAIYDGSGGSGFVNTAANASYRPSGYTGVQLDSGSTTAGQNSGDGYAKITVLGDGDSGGGGDSGNASISWATRTGTWNESSKNAAADGKSFTCVSPGDSGSTVIRCTFSGVTSITFNCVYSGESNYDYLTVGNIDSSCTRDSYGTTLKGTSGTAKDITFTCDTGTHYVEFCYSKDGSVSTSPDNATVYCKSYS